MLERYKTLRRIKLIDVYLYEQSKVKRKKIKHKQDKTVRASIDPGSMRGEKT